MADYIDKKELNEIMFECKNLGTLTERAVHMFKLQATKISNSYDYRSPEDKEDAIMFAVADFCAYWKNYKINPMAQIKFVRNFFDGETVKVIVNETPVVFVARNEPKDTNDFKIGDKINKTLENLMNVINQTQEGGSFWASIHKVTSQIKIIDSTCYSNSKAIVIVNKVVGNRIALDDHSPTIGDSVFKFGDPPPAFNFFTSLARNGLFKASKVLYSETQKNMTPFSRVNKDNGGMFNQ